MHKKKKKEEEEEEEEEQEPKRRMMLLNQLQNPDSPKIEPIYKRGPCFRSL